MRLQKRLGSSAYCRSERVTCRAAKSFDLLADAAPHSRFENSDRRTDGHARRYADGLRCLHRPRPEVVPQTNVGIDARVSRRRPQRTHLRDAFNRGSARNHCVLRSGSTVRNRQPACYCAAFSDRVDATHSSISIPRTKISMVRSRAARSIPAIPGGVR